MKNLSKAILVVSVCLTSLPALAQCRKSNVCDDYGQNCRAQDICDSTLDLPSIGLAPLTPLPTMELKLRTTKVLRGCVSNFMARSTGGIFDN